MGLGSLLRVELLMGRFYDFRMILEFFSQLAFLESYGKIVSNTE